MRQLLFDSTRSLTRRMPSLKSILKDSSMKKTTPTMRRSVSVSARSARLREYDTERMSEIDKEVSYRWVIMPRAPWKVRWDLWIGLIILYSVVLIPYRIGFGIDVEVRLGIG